MIQQSAISTSISILSPFNRAGGLTSSIVSKNSKLRRVVGILTSIGVIGLVAIPIETEFRVQSAKRSLRKTSSVNDCAAMFGNHPREADGSLKRILAERLSLKVTNTDKILIFQREGIPYWAIYLVSSDGETITEFAVDRFW
jgi:hypothetical protein